MVGCIREDDFSDEQRIIAGLPTNPGIGPADCRAVLRIAASGHVRFNDAPPTSLLTIEISERQCQLYLQTSSLYYEWGCRKTYLAHAGSCLAEANSDPAVSGRCKEALLSERTGEDQLGNVRPP